MNDVIDKIYCINLPQSQDRWKKVSASFENLGLGNKLNRIEAVKPPQNFFLPNQVRNTQLGCTLSHLKTLGTSLKESEGNILVVEDDISPSDECNKIVSDVIKNLPKTWSICYFGGQPRKPLNLYKKSENINIYRAKGIIGAYAYAVNFNYIKSLFSYTISSLSTNSYRNSEGYLNYSGVYDYILLEFAAGTESFITYPLVFKPFPAVSTITGQDYSQKDLDNLIENRWKWVK